MSARTRGRRTAAGIVAGVLGISGLAAVAVAVSRQVPEPPTMPQAAPVDPGTVDPGDSPTPSRSGAPSPGPRRSVPAPPGTTEQGPEAWRRAQPLRRSLPVRVRIPAIGVDADMVRLGLQADEAMEVPVGPDPVGWYDRSPTPGQIGPSVLAAHVTWNGAEGAFFELATLKAGDTIEVDRADGSRATFVVRKLGQYPKSAFPTRDVYGNTPGPSLRLITCAGDFDPGEHRYADNVIVYADLATASA